ncbi:MAG: PAS domain-containing protein [Ignavibacteriae bacterium]|nr:PAS domain-containing protein [Ignavibacteriota bacterium]
MTASQPISEDTLIRVLDSLNIGLVFIDAQNRIAFVNKSAEQIRNMKREDRIGSSILECHRGAMHARVLNVIDDFRKGTDGPRHRVVRSNGRTFDNSYNVVVDESGDYKGIALVSQDVTEKLMLEQQLKKTNEELERKVAERTAQIEATYRELQHAQEQLMHTEKMASIGRFVSGVAHEINNPLDGIQSCIRLVLSELDNKAQAENYLTLGLEGLYKIELLVKRLLDYARPHVYERTPLNIETLLDNVLAFAQFRLNGTPIRVERKSCDALPAVDADEHYLQQVFLNIILNAFDAMKTGGTLTISTCQQGDGRVAIEITDTGCGIPKDALHKIFDPFFTTKSHESGTGLGLYLSYNVVNNHGGDIEVRSEEGVGTTFVVLLPAALSAGTK